MALARPEYADLTADIASSLLPDSEARDLLNELRERRDSIQTEQQRFRSLCDRVDALYYANDVTRYGADLWADDPYLDVPGHSHVSINTPAVFVDIPAALQSVEPVENVLASKDEDSARTAAAGLERVRFAWKREEGWDLKRHKAATTKGLYGRAASLVYWDEAKGRPCVDIIDQPRHLYLGYKSDAYDELSWAAYEMRMTPEAVVEEYGVEITPVEVKTQTAGSVIRRIVPFVSIPTDSITELPSRAWLTYGAAKIEVWNYWYLRPTSAPVRGRKTKMSVWNAVFVGGALVVYAEHPEYGGVLPVIPVYNTYIPGVPDGRSDLYDVEQLIVEAHTTMTAGAQMIHAAAGGTFWQLTGAEAPLVVPDSAKPKLNQVVSPGPGNRIEPIQPTVIEFQLEQYLNRLDRYTTRITGLNELLLGEAPAQILSSSKAINALVANYEARLSMRRSLFYAWDRQNWDLVLTVWKAKDKTVREIVEAGGGWLDIEEPSLTPRDDEQAAARAMNLLNAKIWSRARAQDATGVDDPEQETEIIRQEQTDATVNPAQVQVMVQLLMLLKQLQQQVPAGVQQQAQATLARGQNDLRSALAGQTPQGQTQLQAPGETPAPPPEAGTPPPGGGPAQPGGGPFASLVQPGGPQVNAQTMLQGGQVKGRILTNQQLGALGKRGG